MARVMFELFLISNNYKLNLSNKKKTKSQKQTKEQTKYGKNQKNISKVK